MKRRPVLLTILTALPLLGATSVVSQRARSMAPEVALLRAPSDGIQPQAVMDDAGVLHLLYFSGEPSGGDLYYVRKTARAAAFSQPARVNSIPGSAMATGNVRGGQLALGRGGRAHVTWNGAVAITTGTRKHIPMWYARLDEGGTRFEPQRDLTEWTTGLDGGGTVAADRAGNVYAAWHASGATEGEAHRTVYVARSRDEGRSFGREERVSASETGACGCCGMRGLVDSDGALQLLYRTATDTIHRDATWLTVSPTTQSRAPQRLHEWKLQACPMSTFAMARNADGIVAAWETRLQIYYATLDTRRGTASEAVAAPGTGARKHPAVAVSVSGDRLIAWTEGMGWSRGGTLAWAIVGRGGQMRAGASNAAQVPPWSLVSAVANPDGSFTIVH